MSPLQQQEGPIAKLGTSEARLSKTDALKPEELSTLNRWGEKARDSGSFAIGFQVPENGKFAGSLVVAAGKNTQNLGYSFISPDGKIRVDGQVNMATKEMVVTATESGYSGNPNNPIRLKAISPTDGLLKLTSSIGFLTQENHDRYLQLECQKLKTEEQRMMLGCKLPPLK